LGDSFDVKTRARATSVWVVAFAVAPAFTGPLVGMLLASLDWRWVFLVLAVPALAVAAVNGRLLPKTGNASGSSEPSDDGLAPLPMKRLLAMPSLWLAGGAFAFWNVAYWGLLGWMPSYLALERHLDIKSSGLLSGIPYAFGLVGVGVSGWLGSGLLLRYRPYLLGGSHLAAAVALTLSYAAGSVTGSLVGLSVAAFFIYCGLSTYCTLVVDLAPRMARAAFSGAASTLGQVGSVAAPAIIGYLVSHTGTFSAGFALMSCSLLAASACAFALSPLNRMQLEPAVLTRT